MSLKDRLYALTVVASKEDLLERFNASPWPLCTAFQLGDLLFANVSDVANETQEFAVIYDNELIECLPISEMTSNDLKTSLDWLIQGGETFLGVAEIHTEPATAHNCARCR